MRIISKFKDYYDSVQSYGQDPNLVYLRQSATFRINFGDWPELAELKSPFMDADVCQLRAVLLAVCGRLHRFYAPTSIHFNVEVSTSPAKLPLIFSEETLRDALITEVGEEYAQELLKYNSVIVHKEIGERLHQFVNAPVALIIPEMHYMSNSAQLITNPRLANFDFQSIFEPFACYQEIAMYLANQLAQPDIAPLRTGDDETIARAKGFDEKSFRTAAPGNKKLNRKQNRERKKQS